LILQNLQLLQQSPAIFALVIGIGVVGLVVGFTIHEFCHALAAHGEGDSTAHQMGRLTFNPIKHIDLFGFILILVIGFGWAKPVQVDPYNLRHGRLGMSMVALAGPLSNFVLAFVLGLVFRFGLLPVVTDTRFISGIVDILGFAAFLAIFFNLILGIFNLIPLPPLDGSKVLGGLLPRSMYGAYAQFERYGWMPLLGLIAVNLLLSYTLGISFLSDILLPPVRFFLELAVGPEAARFI
jgi:Zn-dependent protease